MIDEQNYVKRNNEVFANEIDGEAVMMNIQTGKYYGLDEIGSRIWELMERKIQVKEIIEQLQKEYDVSEQQCKTDVLNLLNDLKSNQLIDVYD
jgi:myo-inositol-1-phosphate synthase